jgi:hypothetical protein
MNEMDDNSKTNAAYLTALTQEYDEVRRSLSAMGGAS